MPHFKIVRPHMALAINGNLLHDEEKEKSFPLTIHV